MSPSLFFPPNVLCPLVRNVRIWDLGKLGIKQYFNFSSFQINQPNLGKQTTILMEINWIMAMQTILDVSILHILQTFGHRLVGHV
jgi:hypothetical protein